MEQWWLRANIWRPSSQSADRPASTWRERSPSVQQRLALNKRGRSKRSGLRRADHRAEAGSARREDPPLESVALGILLIPRSKLENQRSDQAGDASGLPFSTT